jgi:2-polyprenyl-3-methyl-5-hydroxy-6-metoxy-1,4-benzoquinol methylase
MFDEKYTIRDCPLCDSDQGVVLGKILASDVVAINKTYFRDALTRLDIEPSSEWPIFKCKCGMLYAQRLPSQPFLSTLYDSAIDSDVAKKVSTGPSWIAFQLAAAVDVLRSLPFPDSGESQHRLLDFGCGYGSLVEALQSEYVTCVGFETSNSRLEYHKHRNLSTYGEWTQIVKRGPYSAVFVSEVLEHVPDPKAVLKTLRSVLKPNGLISVTVPNFPKGRMKRQLRLAASSKPFTQELNPWEHLNYFSSTHLRRMLVQTGFREVPTTVDIGVRLGLSGTKRLGNCLKSMLRLLCHGMSCLPGNTRVLAQRVD